MKFAIDFLLILLTLLVNPLRVNLHKLNNKYNFQKSLLNLNELNELDIEDYKKVENNSEVKKRFSDKFNIHPEHEKFIPFNIINVGEDSVPAKKINEAVYEEEIDDMNEKDRADLIATINLGNIFKKDKTYIKSRDLRKESYLEENYSQIKTLEAQEKLKIDIFNNTSINQIIQILPESNKIKKNLSIDYDFLNEFNLNENSTYFNQIHNNSNKNHHSEKHSLKESNYDHVNNSLEIKDINKLNLLNNNYTKKKFLFDSLDKINKEDAVDSFLNEKIQNNYSLIDKNIHSNKSNKIKNKDENAHNSKNGIIDSFDITNSPYNIKNNTIDTHLDSILDNLINANLDSKININSTNSIHINEKIIMNQDGNGTIHIKDKNNNNHKGNIIDNISSKTQNNVHFDDIHEIKDQIKSNHEIHNKQSLTEKKYNDPLIESSKKKNLKENKNKINIYSDINPILNNMNIAYNKTINQGKHIEHKNDNYIQNSQPHENQLKKKSRENKPIPMVGNKTGDIEKDYDYKIKNNFSQQNNELSKEIYFINNLTQNLTSSIKKEGEEIKTTFVNENVNTKALFTEKLNELKMSIKDSMNKLILQSKEIEEGHTKQNIDLLSNLDYIVKDLVKNITRTEPKKEQNSQIKPISKNLDKNNEIVNNHNKINSIEFNKIESQSIRKTQFLKPMVYPENEKIEKTNNQIENEAFKAIEKKNSENRNLKTKNLNHSVNLNESNKKNYKINNLKIQESEAELTKKFLSKILSQIISHPLHIDEEKSIITEETNEKSGQKETNMPNVLIISGSTNTKIETKNVKNKNSHNYLTNIYK